MLVKLDGSRGIRSTASACYPLRMDQPPRSSYVPNWRLWEPPRRRLVPPLLRIARWPLWARLTLSAIILIGSGMRFLGAYLHS